MTIAAFLDELTKLGASGLLVKQAESLADLHNEQAPEADPAVPHDASTRAAATLARSAIEPGALGAVTTPQEPIDRQRFNRVWNQGSR